MAPPLRITRAGVLASLLVILVAATCVRLGFWQLHRLQERRAHNALVSARIHAAPLQLYAAPADTAGLAYRAAEATGTWDGARSIVLAARPLDGDPGVWLLTPLRLSDGRAILVIRGWLPSPDAAHVDIEPYTLSGRAEVRGLLVSPPLGAVPPTAGPRLIWYHLDQAALARQFPYPLAPVLLQAMAPAASTRQLPRPLPPPPLDEGPHLSYAIQWFSFAAIGLIGWIVLLLRGERGERGDRGDRGDADEDTSVRRRPPGD